MILGLDASTSVVGWCILKSSDGSVLDAGHIEFDSDDDLYERLRKLRQVIIGLFDGRDHVSHVFIEEPKKMFGSSSSAHVMSLLQRWNGMVSAMLSFELRDPVLINEKTARKSIGITIPHKCKNAKEVTAQHVKESGVMPEDLWQYKRTGRLKDHCLDVVDAYVVARAGYLRASSSVP